jgi:hypothetical protein
MRIVGEGAEDVSWADGHDLGCRAAGGTHLGGGGVEKFCRKRVREVPAFVQHADPVRDGDAGGWEKRCRGCGVDSVGGEDGNGRGGAEACGAEEFDEFGGSASMMRAVSESVRRPLMR